MGLPPTRGETLPGQDHPGEPQAYDTVPGVIAAASQVPSLMLVPRTHAEPGSPGAMEGHSSPTVDWLGVNYYLPHHATSDSPTTDFHLNISGDPQETSRFSLQGLFRFVQNPRGRHTDWNWEVDPDSLYRILVRIRDLRCLPVYVTENGIGLPDQVREGQVDDSSRIAYVTGNC